VKITIPANMVKKLREDVKITIQPGLTGMSHVNIVSAGKSAVPLDPSRMITGVETSFFDPVLEQAGLGPVERDHLSHTIAQVRETVDSVAPRVRQMLGSLQETSTNLRDMSQAIRPAVESTVSQIDDLTRRINANSPRIEASITRLENLAAHAQLLLSENRDNIRQTVASVRDFTASLNDIVAKDRIKVERLLDGMDVIRARSDRVLYQTDQITGQVAQILARCRAEIERSVTNVRDATDWGNKLMQKIFSNPFVLSPFYKPSHEDLRFQGVYDTALAFTHGAQELNDAVKTLQTMSARPATPQQQQEILQLQQRVRTLADQLNQTSQRLAESLKQPVGRQGLRR
jgi:phospholipid/cholesterol/gamma-HCH transport system substrate-binding protein